MAIRYRDLANAISTVNRDGAPETEIRYSNWQFGLLIAVPASFAVFFFLAAFDTFIRVYADDFPAVVVVPAAIGLFFASLAYPPPSDGSAAAS